MKTIIKQGIKFHPNAWFLLPGFGAITLFGHVWVKKSFKSLERYLETRNGRKTINHERIHMLQADATGGYWRFYTLYIYYWIKNLFKYGFTKEAYYKIPFEAEAYYYEQYYDYSKSQWKKFRYLYITLQ